MSPDQSLPNVTVTQLAYALSVARLRHFGAAARACHVAQPTLSVQVQKLEETLGVILFDRSKKPVMVTDVGRRIVDQAALIIQETQRIADIVADAQGRVQGDFHLGVIPTLAPYLLPRFLPGFTARYPDVRMFLTELQTDAIVHRLREGGLDAGLLATPLGHRDLTERPLFHEPFVLYVARSHPLFRKSSIRRSDLRREDIWLLAEGHCLRTQVLTLCESRMARSDDRRVRFDGGSLETLVRVIDSGDGYTLLPALAAEQVRDPERRAMVKPFADPPPSREISLVFNRAFLKRGILEALAETIPAAVPPDLVDRPARASRVVPVRPRGVGPAVQGLKVQRHIPEP